jgi:hypothetical protein
MEKLILNKDRSDMQGGGQERRAGSEEQGARVNGCVGDNGLSDL